MRFESPFFLLLLILLPLLFRFWRGKNRPPALNFSRAIPKSVATSDPSFILLCLRMLALALLIFSLARPQKSFSQIDRKVSGIDIVLTLDVSASMNIEDLAEASRLDVAKGTLKEFVHGRRDDRIGFVIFSGEPLTLAPPTLDYGIVQKAIDDVEIGILRDGTAIGDGLSLATNRLRNSDAKSKVIILVTDGDNNLGQVDPATAGEIAAGYGIRVYTIAIGREGRVKMPIRHKSAFGQAITTYQWFDNALNPELLMLIAKTTQGKFYRVTDAGALESVFKEIDRLEKSDMNVHEKVRYEDVFATPLFWGVLLLAIEQVLSFLVWRVVP